MKSIIRRFFPKQLAWYHARRKFWMDYIRDGEWELRELSRYTPRSSLAIDVGGNIGVYAYHLSRLAKTVVSFEPNPIYFQKLQALGLRGVRVECTALSSSDGNAVLRIPEVNGRPDSGMASLEASVVGDSQTAERHEVVTRTLDSYGFDNVGFIKIDVEGHEEEVLHGAAATLAHSRPALLIEIEERHNPGGLDRIASWLRGQGYQGYFFENGERRPLSAFIPSIHQDKMNLTEAPPGSRRRRLSYINNFLFIHQR